MNKRVKSPRNFIALVLLATVIMASTGCGHKLCTAYGGKQPSANQVEVLH